MAEHSPWDELAVGLALGALEPEDEETFLSHLRGCAQCAQTLSDMEAVVGQLAYAAPYDEPPPQLLESIMREVHASNRVVTPLRRTAATMSAPQPRRGSGTSRGWESSWLARAAALILVLALAGWNYQLRADNHIKQLSIENAAAFGALIADPAATAVPLKSAGAERATLVRKGERAYLVVNNFARSDNNSIYVLWARNSGSAEMHGIDSFQVVHDGPTYIPVRRDLANSAGISAFALSKEAGPAIPATPSTPIAVGSVESATAAT